MVGKNRQNYYRAKSRVKKRQQIATEAIKVVNKIRARQTKIGTKKIYHECQEKFKELGVGRDRLFDILRANKMLIKPKKRYHVTTNSFHRFYKHKNLTENLDIVRPEQLFVSDITYLGTRDNPMYLALVTDAYSKKIMGYDVSDSLAASGAIRALKMAIRNREYKKQNLIHHSDKGLQYCCDEYQEVLQHGAHSSIRCSMTEKYDPYQNAIAERVNGILKQEFLNGITISDVGLMKLLVAQAIQIYNNERPHLSNHYLKPNQMHRQRKLKRKTYKKKNNSRANHAVIN